MVVFDIILLIPLVWFTFKGFTKGLIIELASLVALILGIYLAYFFSDFTKGILTNRLGLTSQYIQPVSFVVTFIVVVILVFILAKALEAVVKTASLGFFNKMAGALFGFSKITLICALFLYQLVSFDSGAKIVTTSTREKSYTFKPLMVTAETVLPYIKNIREKVKLPEKPAPNGTDK
ncbi:MAG: Colicin V production protein [Bacteroidetes bacterium ADurb.Bin408]|nr:MAG: Colicin V production protein [Bacteroidetes bacterium ADurb.Bin408]